MEIAINSESDDDKSMWRKIELASSLAMLIGSSVFFFMMLDFFFDEND